MFKKEEKSREALLKKAKLKVEQMEKGSAFTVDQRAQNIIQELINEVEKLVEENKALDKQVTLLKLLRLRDNKRNL